MSFIRPQAIATINRWRDVLIGLAAALLGVWWTLNAAGILQWLGPVVVVGGGAIAWLGWQRGRFHGNGQGRGAVEVDEGQITYLGPLSGGAVSLREMTSVTLDGRHYPAHWELVQPGAETLLIPVDAAGSDALLDAFASLPGFRTEAMFSALSAETSAPIEIWTRGTAQAPQPKARRIS